MRKNKTYLRNHVCPGGDIVTECERQRRPLKSCVSISLMRLSHKTQKQNPNRKESEIFSRSSEQSWWWWHLTFLSSSLFVFFRIKQLQTEKTNKIQSNEKKNSDQFDFEGRWPNSQKLVMLLHVQRPFSIFFLFQLSWPIKGFLTTMLETFVSCVDVYTIIINY